MLKLNGKKFAANNQEFTESIFSPGGTCVGFYRANKRSITLLDQNKNKVGVITCHGVLACATKQSDGQWWYSYADIKLIGPYKSYLQQCDEIDAALKLAGINKVYA